MSTSSEPVRSTPPPPGIYVPAVLFFDVNEDLDVPSIKAHILRLAHGGVTGILVQGCNGEAQHLYATRTCNPHITLTSGTTTLDLARSVDKQSP